MKSIVLSSVVTALLVFSGCSTKEPAVQKKTEEVASPVVQEVEAVTTETVASENSTINSSTNELSMNAIESKLPTIYFDFDKYNIKPEMQERIDAAAELGKTGAKAFSVKLEGNCDEWGSDEYNFALGLKRANAVKKALVADGIDPSRISMVSYGESNPVCTEHTRACWAKNRRVNFKLLP
ncbi:peptidoglycan-associated lipoprotein Pal [Sulfurimonas autotrophica]|uniref:Peptidoglycan-associated lipoprotein n=1 Tax=Sulfurimonas autotrophica (strain ATCC BAA-671 / DSM 16294 / JCM 11897 / OK10) TaxID=563040 RepID=E0UQV0_SULAO|nr:peptidoglycan-associated lipoprotein Pal [Sulfurimonas autotrophica]ADN08831.1 OmpA/MotB domain protein [Sulfurimonas autotrophica DSM 16294]